MSGIRKELEKALNSGKYFITISYKKDQESRVNDLNHFYVTKDFPRDRIVPSLNHIQKEINKTDAVQLVNQKPPSRNSVHDW